MKCLVFAVLLTPVGTGDLLACDQVRVISESQYGCSAEGAGRSGRVRHFLGRIFHRHRRGGCAGEATGCVGVGYTVQGCAGATVYPQAVGCSQAAPYTYPGYPAQTYPGYTVPERPPAPPIYEEHPQPPEPAKKPKPKRQD